MSYTETHRTLLTLVRSTKFITHTELESAFAQILKSLEPDKEHDDTVLNSYISTINYRIGQHGFKIDKKANQVTGELTYVFINTNAADAKQNTTYSPKELEVINSIIDGIMEASDFSLGRVNANQIIAGAMGRTLREAEIFVDSLIDGGWLESTTEERLVLSTRSLSELKGYIVDRFGTKSKPEDSGRVFLCKQCNEIVTMGTLQVNVFHSFHFRCYDIFFTTQDNGEVMRIGVDGATIR